MQRVIAFKVDASHYAFNQMPTSILPTPTDAAKAILDRHSVALDRLKGQERCVSDIDGSLRTLRMHCVGTGEGSSNAFAHFDRVLERHRVDLQAMMAEFEAIEAERIASKAALKDGMQVALEALTLLLSVDELASVLNMDGTEDVITEVAKATTHDSLAANLQIRPDPPITGVFKNDQREYGAASSNTLPIYIYPSGAILADAFPVPVDSRKK